MEANGIFTVADRRAQGHAERTAVPRSVHAVWAPAPGRRDPVELLTALDAPRNPDLLPIRYGRMQVDKLAFLRGAAAVMAADLSTTPATSLRVQACGDAHLMNFGTFASPEGTPVFDLNDFDETLPAPFEWDVKRLATSFAVAVQVQGGSDKQARMVGRSTVRAYRRHMDQLASLDPLAAWHSHIDLTRTVADIGDRQVRRLAREHLAAISDGHDPFRHLVTSEGRLHLPERPPVIYRLDGNEPVAHAAFGAYLDSLAEDRRVLVARYRLQDVAFKAVGVGSVGTFCALGLFATADAKTLILQLKEASASVLAPYAGPSQYDDQGERVVVGQRLLQADPDIFLGWAKTHPEGRHFYVRRLKDPRLSAAGAAMASDALPFYAPLCGRTLARAHARSGDAARIAGYLGGGKAFDNAIAAFAMRYAGQTASDHALLCQAIRDGRIPATAVAAR